MTTQPGVLSDSSMIITALSVSPRENDHVSLQRIFDGPKWVLHQAGCIASAISILYRHRVAVVICEHDLVLNTWTDMLERLSVLPDAPPLIVTSRLADDRLWAEALNLGAYDVLAKPFDRQEVIRVVHSAWLSSQRGRAVQINSPLKVMIAGGG